MVDNIRAGTLPTEMAGYLLMLAQRRPWHAKKSTLLAHNASVQELLHQEHCIPCAHAYKMQPGCVWQGVTAALHTPAPPQIGGPAPPDPPLRPLRFHAGLGRTSPARAGLLQNKPWTIAGGQPRNKVLQAKLAMSRRAQSVPWSCCRGGG